MNFLDFDNLVPAQRCRWIDLMRGWAVIFMIEAHCINVWLRNDLMTHDIHFFNGLIAPSFIMCSGYSQSLSIFNSSNEVQSFYPLARRIGIILLCGYLLHAPVLTFEKWSVVTTIQNCRELFKIDVLQCIGFSILILYGLARLVKNPIIYALLALLAAIGVSTVAPALWQPHVANGFWLPVRGLINGNTDRGVTALFPLMPWFAFAAFGATLGIFYRQVRIITVNNKARWSESKWLIVLVILGIVLCLWGSYYVETWLTSKSWSEYERWRLYNTTLPSVAKRIGTVCIIGGALGIVDLLFKKSLPGAKIISIASQQSLPIYLVHLKIIFGFLLIEPIISKTHWYWHSLDWYKIAPITLIITIISIIVGTYWQKLYTHEIFTYKVQRVTMAIFATWLLSIGLGIAKLVLT